MSFLAHQTWVRATLRPYCCVVLGELINLSNSLMVSFLVGWDGG